MTDPTPRHPIQPLIKDKHGVLRFKRNAIVDYLLEHGGIDLNQIATLPFEQEDREQFAQLIGYSLDGFFDLSYVRDTTYITAARMADGASESDARIATLEEALAKVRDGLREIVPAVFHIHPDDLHD